MPVPYTFGTATAAIPLSQLDSNFATAITLGNTAVYLGNTTTSIGNLTLTNVTISSGEVTTGNVSVAGNVTLTGGTANGVAYLNTSKALTTGSALVFDGSNLGVGVTPYNPVGATMTSLTVQGSAYGTLYVQANSAAVRGTFNATSANNTVNLAALTNHPLTFATNDTERARIDSSGNLGIGTSSPTQKLDVNGVVTTTPGLGSSGAFALGYGSNAASRSWRMRIDDAAFGDFSIQQTTTQTGSTYATKLNIDPSGNLLVHGTQSTANTFMQVNINGGNSAEGYMAVMANGSNLANQIAGIYLARTNNSIVSSVDGSGAFRDNIIVTAGGSGGVILTTTATAWASNSDIRKKIIIEPISNALNGLLSWRTIIGRYKTDDEQRRRLFLIAQDVQATNPEAVVVQDAGQESEELLLGYTDTIPVLVAAIKEQQALITQLQADVAALKGASA